MEWGQGASGFPHLEKWPDRSTMVFEYGRGTGRKDEAGAGRGRGGGAGFAEATYMSTARMGMSMPSNEAITVALGHRTETVPRVNAPGCHEGASFRDKCAYHSHISWIAMKEKPGWHNLECLVLHFSGCKGAEDWSNEEAMKPRLPLSLVFPLLPPTRCPSPSHTLLCLVESTPPARIDSTRLRLLNTDWPWRLGTT